MHVMHVMSFASKGPSSHLCCVVTMASSAGRAIQRLRSHVPLIKFKFGKEHRAVPPPTPSAVVSSSNTSKTPSSTQRGQTIEFHMLPEKYQRLALTQEEIDLINMGGPD